MDSRDAHTNPYGTGSGGQEMNGSPRGFGSQSGSGSSFRSTEEIKGHAQAKTGEVIDQVQQKAGEAVDQAQKQAKSMLSTRKDQVSDGLGNVAQALRHTGQGLRGQGQQDQLAQYADQAADQVERFSTFLRERDVNQLTVEVERLARRQPALFLGGALALGMIGARFLKSSSQRAQQMQNYSSQGTDAGSYSSYSSYRSNPGNGQTSSDQSTGYRVSSSSTGSDYETTYGGAGDSYATQKFEVERSDPEQGTGHDGYATGLES